jgi:Lipocalin-like domain
MILGKWKGIEWLVDGHPSSHTPGEAVFTFNEDGLYTFEYSGNVENGKYYVNNNELFTTPDGGIKMMVKIPKLTQDTLIFDMNRGGQAEKLTLIRN